MNTSLGGLSEAVLASKKHAPSEGRPALLVTAEHVIAGNVDTRNLRLSDMLNEPDTSYIRIRDVGVFSGGENKRIATLRECVIPKVKLELALILDADHEAPHKRRYQYVEKKAIPVFLKVHGCLVRGSLPLQLTGASDPDPVWVLTQKTPHFFPVVQATVSWSASDPQPLQVPVAIVNTDAVALFSVGWETNLPETAGPCAAQQKEGAITSLERLACCRERSTQSVCLGNFNDAEADAAREKRDEEDREP